MRKYASILFVLIFVFNIGGYDCWYHILQISIQNEIRKEIRNGLKETDLCKIITPTNGKSGIYWIKLNKEFIFNSRMYDVVKLKVQGKKTIYYCYDDKKEKKLIENFSKNKNSKTETEKRLKKVFQDEYYPQQFKYSSHIDLAIVDYNQISLLYKSNFKNIPHPPPEKAYNQAAIYNEL